MEVYYIKIQYSRGRFMSGFLHFEIIAGEILLKKYMKSRFCLLDISKTPGLILARPKRALSQSFGNGCYYAYNPYLSANNCRAAKATVLLAWISLLTVKKSDKQSSYSTFTSASLRWWWPQDWFYRPRTRLWQPFAAETIKKTPKELLNYPLLLSRAAAGRRSQKIAKPSSRWSLITDCV